jgi:hypothetical protein
MRIDPAGGLPNSGLVACLLVRARLEGWFDRTARRPDWVLRRPFWCLRTTKSAAPSKSSNIGYPYVACQSGSTYLAWRGLSAKQSLPSAWLMKR